jgi:hypothetical protein
MWRPLLQFLFLGSVLFAIDRLWWSALPPPPVVIDAARVTTLRADLTRALRRPPTREELERALGPEVDDELLFRAALERGYVEEDPVVFRRLVQNLRFADVEGEADPRDDVEIYRDAIAMGLHETDIVVRRRLVQRMRLDLESVVGEAEPEDATLRAYFERNAERYRSPARTRLLQVYYAREHEDRARADLASLRADGTSEDVASRGDPFLLSAEQPPQTRKELADRFGGDFADGAFTAPPGEWSGPLGSAYGFHLVFVHERTAERALEFEEVREPVRHAVAAKRREDALERALAGLREGVEVEVEWPSDTPG